MADISALERQKQIIKQAIKIRHSPAEEERLGDLVTQWRHAGRDIVEMLFQVMPRPETSNGGNTLSYWETESKSSTSNNPSKTNIEDEGETEDWNYGSMMRALQVDPHLLGWDNEAEDWIG